MADPANPFAASCCFLAVALAERRCPPFRGLCLCSTSAASHCLLLTPRLCPDGEGGCGEKRWRGSGEAALLGKMGLPVVLIRSQAGERNCSLVKSCAAATRRDFATDPGWWLQGEQGQTCTFPDSGRVAPEQVPPSAALVPRECYHFLRTRVSHNGTGGVPSRGARACQQGLCSSPFQLCGQLSAAGSAHLMTAFHQQSSCCSCSVTLCVCFAMQVAPSTPKHCLPNQGKRFQGFFQPWGGKKSCASVFPCYF